MKFRLWLNIITFGALILLLVVSRADIVEVFRHLGNLNLWVLALMVPVQFACFYMIAKVYQRYVQASHMPQVPLHSLYALAMEVNFVHHVFPSAGVSAVSYVGLRMKQFGVSTAQSTMLQLVRTAFAFITFIPLLLVGLLLLSLENRASNLIILVASSLATIITLGTIALVYIIGSKHRSHVAALFVVRWTNWLICRFRPSKPETISLRKVEETLNELHEHYREVRANWRGMQPVAWWSVASNIFELLLIYVVFMAHDVYINPGALIIGFAVANLAGLIAFLPGGVGVYEPLMVTALVSGGVATNAALSAILVYRVIGTLLSLPTGYILYHRALNNYERTRTQR